MWIAEWVWDDHNTEHIARHGLWPGDIDDLWRGTPRFRRNKRGRAATHQMIGPDRGGRLLAAFVAPVPGVPGRWRVITARPATAVEKEWWETA